MEEKSANAIPAEYMPAEMEIVAVDAADIICTSSGLLEDEDYGVDATW